MTTETDNAVNSVSQPIGAEKRPPSPRPSRTRGLWMALAIAAVVLAFVIYSGLHSRARADAELRNATRATLIPTVSVVHPTGGASAQEIVIPGNMQPFIDTPIWARASGYLKAWYVDIGGRVKSGQLLAVIESPETNHQLQQAQEDLSTAQANLKLAQITQERYQDLFKTDSVSKQDVDNAVQDAAAKNATVKGAQANVRRLQQLVAYENIYAPFGGVITARNVDVGALVDAGANTPGKELFHLASIKTLRVYVNLPEMYDRAAQPGTHAYLTLDEFPGRKFDGKIVRDSDAIDQASRTLLAEVDVNNPTGELLPGSYVSVHLKLPTKGTAVSVPSNALLFRSEGLRVAVVRNNRVSLVPITIGHDTGESVEVVSGLNASDEVIVDPSDSITDGQQVQVAGSAPGA